MVVGDLVRLFNKDLTGILSLCEYFDLETEKWKSTGSLNVQRCTSNATIFRGKVYVFGGFNGSGRVREIERYNELNDRWELVQLGLRYHIEACVLAMLSDSEVLLMGGKDHYSQTATATVYDLEKSQIEEFPKMAVSHVLAKGGKFGNRLICFGGSTNTVFEYFNFETCEWKKRPTFEFLDGQNFGRASFAQGL